MKKLTLIIAILLAGQITAETIIVDQGGTGSYKTIKEGITASSTGDTVLVQPGTYTDNINWESKTIKIISAEGPDSTILDSVVYIRTNGLSRTSKLSGFCLKLGYII